MPIASPDPLANPAPARRPFLAAAVSLATALTLTACGGSDSAAGTTDGGNAAEVATRTVQDDTGSVEVPVEPKRIVALSYAVDALLDVGAPVVGATGELEDAMTDENAAAYASVEKVALGAEIDEEAIAALNPDLIVYGLPAHVEYDTSGLAQIAPTVVLAPGDPSDWREDAAGYADAAGFAEQNTALSDAYDTRVEEISTTHADALAANTFASVYSSGAGEFNVDLGPAWNSTVVVDAGARMYAEVADDEWSITRSTEQLPVLDGADVILLGGDNKGELAAETQALTELPVWAGLAPVQAQQVYTLGWAGLLSYGQATHTLDSFDEILGQLPTS